MHPFLADKGLRIEKAHLLAVPEISSQDDPNSTVLAFNIKNINLQYLKTIV